MEYQRVRSRILVPLTVALCLLLGTFLWETYQEGEDCNRAKLEKSLADVESLFAAYLQRDADMMHAALTLICEDNELRAAFGARDRHAVLQQTAPLFQRMLAEHRITHFYFTDPDRVNLLRVHQPDRFGDVIDRFTLLEAERTGEFAWGIELGPPGTFTLRAVHPWYQDERLLGYVELGEEIDHVMEAMQATLDVQAYPFIRKELLDRRQWETGMRMLGRVAEWDCFEDYVITGGKPVPAGLHEILQGRHRGDPRFDYSLDTQGRQTRVGFLPLLDKGNRAVGELAVQKDFTCHLATSARTLFAAAALCVLIGGVLFAFFYVFLGRIEEDLASARRIAADESRSREEAQARHIEAVRTHRDQLQAVIDGIPSPLMVIDRNHRILLSNRVVRESAGGVDPARLGLTCHRVSHHRDTPCDGPDDPCPLKIAVEKKSPAQTLHEHYDSKGRAYSVEVAATPVFDEQGEVCQIVESCYDVTERTRAVKTLRLQSSALESAANAIVITDRNGRMTWVNPAFTELSGYSLEEAVDRSPNILRSGKQNEAFYRELWQTILAGRVWRGEMVNRRRDGTFFTVDTTITPVPDESGDINHFIAIQQDVTARKQTEADLEAARQAAEAASRVKSEFLANMSHEIRTPMTAILGFTETLLDTGRTRSDQAKAVETIRSNGEHLLSIINDILDLSKIEAGKMPIEQVACSLPQLLSDVKSLMQPRAAAKGLYLDVDCSESLPEEVLTDPTRLRQILINLIGNAVKFTDSGGVRLVARFVGEERPAMRFDVIDTGIGISPHQAEAIFLPFAQGDTSTARQFGGTGLGLTLSKQFAELLGGDLVLADSQPGVGSRFQFSVAARLPDNVKMIDNLRVAVCQEEAKPPAAETAPIRLSCRVLLAEDGADNQRIISYFLQKAGAEVLVAENGRLAVDAALAAAGEGRPFDVILMDMQMPVMSGYEAAALLREENYPHPIIAVTAHAMTDDRRKCLEMGCDDYLSKPIRREELLQVVKRHTQLATATEA